jgi:capsid protein
MAETAPQIHYRDTFIAGFEQHQSLVRDSVTTEAVIKGNQAIFLVADSGGAVATTRGVNGRIPGRADNNTQNTCTLAEYHDKVEKTGFNIFESQGNQTQIMQMTSMAVINRTIDNIILTELATATVTTGAAVPFTVGLFAKAQATLGAAKVPWDGNITVLCSPAALGVLQLAPEFSSALYVNGKPNEDDPSWRDKPMAYRWRNVLIIPHPALANTSSPASENCYMFHKSAIGHAADTKGLQTAIDYNKEDDYSFARTTIYMGAKLLQNTGIVKIPHDATGLYGS